MTDSSHDIRVLNSLIATTHDSLDGYRSAAEDARYPQLQSMFAGRAAERSNVMEKLRQQVRTLGGEPEDDGTLLAGAHRAFMALKDRLTGKTDQSIIEEVERGEDHIKAKFETALEDRELGSAARMVISECYASVQSGHDEVSAMKHAGAGR